MQTWRWLMLGAILCLSALSATKLNADYPTYRILRAPTANAPHKPTHGFYPGYAQPVEAQAYSYGWFGAQPRSHGARHFGFYRDYTEWSWK